MKKEQHHRYATKEEREELLKAVRVNCLTKTPITESYLLREYNTGSALKILVKHGIIEAVDGDKKNVYRWLKGYDDTELPGIVSLCWKRHSILFASYDLKEKEKKVKVKKLGEISFPETSNINLQDSLYDRNYFMTVLREAITMAGNYGVTNYGAYIIHYIDAKL